MEQKSLHQDLFRSKNRPDPFAEQKGEIYVIAKEVIGKWRSFVSVTSPGHQGYLGATIVSTGLTDWQALSIELCLTFVITLVYLIAFDDSQVTIMTTLNAEALKNALLEGLSSPINGLSPEQ
ncbi:hypothetical protein DAPPUDRAFT_261674 [Daphnia pulex]|uniref:Uncharacterized protein n=1 Tax=Daphnia pulex TaxID=6669 RepID=E9HLF5_DAPPU|nr:hypothetical protein DAPPUDRAFT_261674 [Daphnia pulex]|eukprot:EFX67431.1 hypothetical protein DAPPUDRAFT_261674 [Daphnia pulex]